jgi:hypothetical protein
MSFVVFQRGGLSYACSSKTVEGSSLSLEGVEDVHVGDGLSPGVFRVGHGVADDVLKEDLQDAASLLVDEARNSLDASSSSETADGGLGDALDVVAQDAAVALRSALSEPLSSLSSSRHSCCCWFCGVDE